VIIFADRKKQKYKFAHPEGSIGQYPVQVGEWNGMHKPPDNNAI